MSRALLAAIVIFLSFGISAAQNGLPSAAPGINAASVDLTKAQQVSALPWMNTNLSPEQRADLLIPNMTLEQKVEQLSNDTRPAEKAANRPPGCEFTTLSMRRRH